MNWELAAEVSVEHGVSLDVAMQIIARVQKRVEEAE